MLMLSLPNNSAVDKTHPLHADQIASRRLSTRRALGEGCFPQDLTDEEKAELALKNARSNAFTTACFNIWTLTTTVVLMAVANMIL
jgi:hypothetical protein